MCLKDKINYLKRLAEVYVMFFKHYRKSKVEYNEECVTVTYYGRKARSWYYFKKKEILISDIDKLITSLKGKINKEFKKRHSNKYLNG